MRDQFAGDFHDFWKYLFLQFLNREFGSVGICWMKTPDLVVTHGNNRRHETDIYRGIDPDLVKKMEMVRTTGQSIATVKNLILDFAVDFDEDFPIGNAFVQYEERKKYWQQATSLLGKEPYIFFDPDNGLSLMLKAPSERHILIEELSQFPINQIKIIYHHLNRSSAHSDQIESISSIAKKHDLSSRFIKFPGIPAGIFLFSQSEQEKQIYMIGSTFSKKYSIDVSTHNNNALDKIQNYSRQNNKNELLSQFATKNLTNSNLKRCPLCNHSFKGTGWSGLDAHWRAKHENKTGVKYESVKNKILQEISSEDFMRFLESQNNFDRN